MGIENKTGQIELNNGIKVVIYRQKIDRPPMIEDFFGPPPEGYYSMLDHEEFETKLMEVGWIDGEGTPLKSFNIIYGGYTEEGNHYIEWIAILKN